MWGEVAQSLGRIYVVFQCLGEKKKWKLSKNIKVGCTVNTEQSGMERKRVVNVKDREGGRLQY